MEKSERIKDLDITFDPQLVLTDRIELILTSALQMFDFIIRSIEDLTNYCIILSLDQRLNTVL